jgi:hypothetical protein
MIFMLARQNLFHFRQARELISNETYDNVFGMFAGRVASSAQSEIIIALKTFVYESGDFSLAN